MLKTVEIRQTFKEHQMRAETLVRFSADNIEVHIAGDEVMVFIDGNVVETKGERGHK
jgi:hypothetical protein